MEELDESEGGQWEAARTERLRAEAMVVDLANAMDFVLLHLKNSGATQMRIAQRQKREPSAA
jgi:hypothetical protein